MTHDNAGKHTSESGNGIGDLNYTTAYTYDALGNRITKNTTFGDDTTDSYAYTYSTYNQLTSFTENSRDNETFTTSYQYNQNGDMIGKTKTNAANEAVLQQAYVFDVFGKMTQSTNNNITTTYAYDGDGIRMSKTTNNVTTSHILDGMNVVADINGTSVSKYNRGINLFGQITGDEQLTLYSNQHGDIATEYASADSINHIAYDSFGNNTNNASLSTPFGYAGEYTDSETGLIYLRARYYDPEIGRFISEDPIMDGTNWYVYCGNNPVVFVDPNGLAIILSGDSKYWDQTMSELQALTDDTLVYDKETGIVSISSFGEGEKHIGTELISSLISNTDYEVFIQRNGVSKESGNMYGTQILNKNRKSNVINISDVYNSDPSAYLLVQDENGKTSREYFNTIQSFIFLGHELIHSYRNMNGAFNSDSGGFRYYVNDFGRNVKESIQKPVLNDEFETVGLSYGVNFLISPKRSMHPQWVPARNNRITENALRKEHNMLLRIAYQEFYD